MAKDKFLRGAMILTIAGLMVKIIGSVNRILLSRLLGGEGIGLYQMAYPVYLLLLAVSSAGIPIAISIIVAEFLAKEDYGSVRRVFGISLRLMACVGLVLAGALYVAAGWLVNSGIIQDGRAYYALVALIPAIFFASILASFRGFFQGHQLMTPPAISQIVEQLIRVMTMVVLAYLLLPNGLEYAAAGAAFGAVPGSITGLIVLSFFYRKYSYLWQRESEAKVLTPLSTGTIVRRLVMLALPVSLANILVPVTSSIDMLLVPNCLVSAGYTVEQATTLFGYLAGMAQPLLMMATIPTMSLAASLVPAVSEANTLGDRDTVVQKASMAMKLCCLITMPAAVGMCVMAEPISKLLYGTTAATSAIANTAPSILLLGMQQVTTGVLQGIGSINLPMIHMGMGILVKIGAVLLLTDANNGIAGAAWATNINFAVTALLNIFALYHHKISFDWYNIIKILPITLASVLTGLAALGTHKVLLGGFSSVTATVAALVVAGVVYALAMPCLGVLKKEELHKLPLMKRFFK